MIISIHDNNAIHGITIFDEEGEPLNRVIEFDTETYLCKLNGGGRAIAAGFVIPCNDHKSLKRFMGTLPDILQQFICYAEEGDDLEKLVREHVDQQLVQRRALREIVRAAPIDVWTDTNLGNHLT